MYLYGAGGHAKVILDTLRDSGIPVNGIFEDNFKSDILSGVPVTGRFDSLMLCDDSLIISIGDNSIRKKVVERLPSTIHFGNAIHPSAVISVFSLIGIGTVVMQGAVIQSSANVGKHCIINTSASVDHDCILSDFVHISPKACLCGNVKVGEGSQVGAGAVVIPGITIGKWSLVGAGAVVLNDVPDYVLVLGNPARVIKKL